MTHRGPFQPLPFCDSVILISPLKTDGTESIQLLLDGLVHGLSLHSCRMTLGSENAQDVICKVFLSSECKASPFCLSAF